MRFWDAVWHILRKLSGDIRPLLLQCCDCGTWYYMAQSIVEGHLRDSDGEPIPVIKCPKCGLKHVVIVTRFDSDVKGFSLRTEYESYEPQC